jgi:cell division protein FtsI/penicillin-binding protein 2
MPSRIRILYIFFILAFITLIARLFYWQVIKGEELARAAKAQYNSGYLLQAPRGNILASDSSWLAARSDAYLVFIYKPDTTLDTRTIANKIAPVFVSTDSEKDIYDEAVRIEKSIDGNDAAWIPLKSKINKEQKIKIENMNIEGIGFEAQETRVYPEASTAAHLLGFVGSADDGSDQGYFGLEGFYDVSLAGKSGFYLGKKMRRECQFCRVKARKLMQ